MKAFIAGAGVFAAGGRQQRISLGPSEFTISNAWHGHSPK